MPTHMHHLSGRPLRPRSALILALATSFASLAPPAPGQPAAASTVAVKVVSHIAGPDGTWDYASFDPGRRRVYVSRGNRVMMVDAESGKVAPDFAAGDTVHAIVPVPGTDVLVTTNSGDASARIIDANDGRLLASLRTSKDPDGAVFDSDTGDVIVVSGDAGNVTLIAPKSRTVAGTIRVGGELEAAAVDGRGRLYVNVNSTNEVAAIDLLTRKVIARYPLPGCRGPTGLAFASRERLVSVCFNGRADILEAGSGRLIASFGIGGFPDSVLVDPIRHLAFVPSAVSGTLAVIALSGSADNSIVSIVHTQVGTRTGAIDADSGEIWLPAARFKGYEHTLRVTGHHPQMEPGTFEMLVLRVLGAPTDQPE